MELTKKESYAIQISSYLKNGRNMEAQKMAEEMIKKFPKEPLSHFMAAKSYYFSKRYEDAKAEGRKAFRLSMKTHDLIASAVVTASSMLMLGEYAAAHKLLLPFEKKRDAEVKKLLVIISMAEGKGKKAGEHYRELHDINRAAAEKLIRRLAKGRRKA